MISKYRGRLDAFKSYLREEACEFVDEDVLNLIGLLDADRETNRVDT